MVDPVKVGVWVVAIRICPMVEVVMVMLEPLIKLATPQPVPFEAINCPVWVGAVVVPVPPLAMATVPER